MSINKERVRWLVDALRSGEYLQGYDFLIRINPNLTVGFCCLGVGCEVALGHDIGYRINTKYYNSPVGLDSYDNVAQQFALPGAVRNWYGFSSSNPNIKILCSQIPIRAYGSWCANCKVLSRNEECEVLRIVTAADANDKYKLNFNEIADGFERMYLQEETNDKGNKHE